MNAPTAGAFFARMMLMENTALKVAKVIIGVCIFAWFGVLLSHRIDLTTADLGRHITNGSILLHGSWTDKHEVLYTNFYSYTLPDQPFINHHWLSGVVFYFVYRISGF